jgi:hypothetical protein
MSDVDDDGPRPKQQKDKSQRISSIDIAFAFDLLIQQRRNKGNNFTTADLRTKPEISKEKC